MKEFDATKTKYWDLGDKEPYIRMSEKSMSKILKAIVVCEGQILDAYCAEKKFGSFEFLYSNRNCCVMFRVKLPIGTEEYFQQLTGFTLSEPIKVHLN